MLREFVAVSVDLRHLVDVLDAMLEQKSVTFLEGLILKVSCLSSFGVLLLFVKHMNESLYRFLYFFVLSS